MASGSQKKTLKTSARKKSSHSAKQSKKKTGAVRRSAKRKKTQESRRQEMSPITLELIFCVILAVSVLMLLGNIHAAGKIGNFVSNGLFGLFGVMEYIFPFLLVFGVMFYLVNRNNRRIARKMTGLSLLLASLCALFELLTGTQNPGDPVKSFFTASASGHRGGGLLGGVLVKLFRMAFGTAGAYILTLALLCIALIVLTQKPLLSELGRRSRLAAKEAHQKRVGLAKEKEAQSEQISVPDSFPKEDEKRMQEEPSQRHGILQNLMERRKEKRTASASNEPENLTNSAFSGGQEAFESLDLSGLHINGKPLDEAEAEDDKEEAVGEDAFASADPLQEKKTRAEKRSPEQQASDIMKIQLEVNDKDQKNQQAAYELPGLDLLTPGGAESKESRKQLMETADKLQTTLEDFGVKVSVVNISQGPTVTRYELQPDQGVKVSRIVNLQDDIKLNLAASEIRIEAPIPGKAAVGIEVPNRKPSTVMLHDLLTTDEFQKSRARLAFAVGKDLSGKPVIADIEKMPHLLIAGATGSGKSVCINTLIVSLLYKYSPDEVRFLMIDPKVVELKIYDGIPHLLIPVVTDVKKAAGALNWAVQEMTQRYQKFASHPGIRDIRGYNRFADEHNRNVKDEKPLEKMPRIVIIVDELADLMMAASGEVEDAIVRLSQLARAAGIHLVIATQRPSVNVVTGLIKANMPSRIALAVTSGVDSRTILDMNGAEKLLGKGDMLFYPQGYPKPARVQGAFVSDDDITRVVGFLTSQSREVEYNKDIEEKIEQSVSAESVSAGHGNADERDEYFADAGRLIIEKDKASIGMLQRAFKIGFNRAARIMDQLCEAGVVGEEEGTKPRKILVSMEEYEHILSELTH